MEYLSLYNLPFLANLSHILTIIVLMFLYMNLMITNKIPFKKKFGQFLC